MQKPLGLLPCIKYDKIVLNIVIDTSNIDLKGTLQMYTSLSALQEALDMSCPEANITG